MDMIPAFHAPHDAITDNAPALKAVRTANTPHHEHLGDRCLMSKDVDNKCN